MIRTNIQDEILAEDLNSRIYYDTKVFNESIKFHVKPNMIIEYGCGNGVILNLLHETFLDSTIVGVDVSENLLNKVMQRNMDRVIPIKSNIVDNVFVNDMYDTVIFHKSLHEVETFEGRDGTIKALKNAYKVLKQEGVLIIRENLRPSSEKVKLLLKSKFAITQFNKFIKDFKPTKVELYSNYGNVYEVNERVAMEFITKYDERDWITEMKEPHFFFSKGEWIKTLNEIGFKKVIINEDTINQIDMDSRKQDIELMFKLPSYRATIIAYKNEE